MLGESGVGKTCLINRYIDDVFKIYPITKTASFKSHLMIAPYGNSEIQQMIWDTAGQEIYRSLASFYYKDSDAVIFVYDITNQNSFDQLSYWINEVKQHAGDNILLTIAGNKSDILENEVVDLGTVKEFAQKNSASFFLVSAKVNSNVREMYMDIAMRKFPELMLEFGFDNSNARRSIMTAKLNREKSNVKLSKDTKSKKDGCC